jgi:hypothetical protein
MKKKYFIPIILSLLVCSCYNSKLGSNKNSKERDRFLKPYVDSINNFTEGSKVPNFLFNPCFDNNSWYWNGMHSPISLREMVVKKVKNKNALEILTKNFVNELSVKCPKQVDSSGIYVIRIPNIEKSFYDLLSKRLEELK